MHAVPAGRQALGFDAQENAIGGGAGAVEDCSCAIAGAAVMAKAAKANRSMGWLPVMLPNATQEP